MAEKVDEFLHSGASMDALTQHYGLGHEFFGLWLDEALVYSAGIWPEMVDHSRLLHGLDQAQRAKIDYYVLAMGGVTELDVLDVGCGWGGTLRRLVVVHGARSGTGITLSPTHQAYSASKHPMASVTTTLETWERFVPLKMFDAIFSFEAIEHFAKDTSSRLERLEIYRRFFGRCFEWLKPEGALALQTICTENLVGVGSGPVPNFIRSEVYPESLPPYLVELVAAWDDFFSLEAYVDDPRAHELTLRSWYLRLREREAVISATFSKEVFARYARYLAVCQTLFRSGEWGLARLVLRRRRRPKTDGDASHGSE